MVTSPLVQSSAAVGWRLEHSYAALPALFWAEVPPTAVRSPRLVIVNRALAARLGLDGAALERDGADLFAGNRLPPGGRPIAQAYAGHQYGHFTPLGDGRALLLGEQLAPDGARFDIQLKGPGPTPFSRRGDGRAALGPMLREYIVSEAMHALGLPTTRSLAVAATGEDVYRDRTLPGAVLTRVAASHIRVGTFQWAAAAGDIDAVRVLLNYTVQRHYPALVGAPDLALAFLDAVAGRQAALVAQWMLVGFVHGVMNTDNMAVSGETIDYGPCAFLDRYDPATVFSSIDAHGRYAYGNQPAIAQWNLARLAEGLIPLIHEDEGQAVDQARGVLDRFAEQYEQRRLDGLRRKLGLFTAEPDDKALAEDLLSWMQSAKADFTNTFVELGHPVSPEVAAKVNEQYFSWHERWRARLSRQLQSPAEAEQLRRAHNPVFIPRNHQVEAALAAAERDDLAPLHRLLEVVTNPYDRTRQAPAYREPAPASEVCYRTFCGT